MKDREFTDYVSTVEDEDGDEHSYTSRVHVVTKDTAGEVSVRGVGQVHVTAGSVLAETDRPGVYDVIPAKDWENMGLTPANEPAPAAPSGDVDATSLDTTDEFDPFADATDAGSGKRRG